MSKFIIAISLALRTLTNNKARTALSLLGIVIGVTSVILILSLGKGLESFVISQVETFGTDIIEIEVKVPQTSQISTQNIGGMIGGTQITTLKIEDAEEVARLSNLGAWYGGILSQQIVAYKDKTNPSFIFGVTAGMIKADDGANIELGKFFSKEDNNSLKQVAILGSKAKETFFSNDDAIGKSVKIGGQKYKVIGVMEDRGSAGVFDFDEIIFVPLKTLQKKIMGVNHIQFIIYKVNDMNSVKQTILEMESIMRDRHDIEYDSEEDKKEKLKDDFAIISIAEAKEMLDQIFLILNVLLVGLASISLVVGGVGIMNIMYVAVTERTKEIGLRKSVGARNTDIFLQFVFESMILTLFGGFIGIVLGYILAEIATYWAINNGFIIEFKVTLGSIFLGFGFSAIVGILFGFHPAKKASKMTPIEALRKE